MAKNSSGDDKRNRARENARQIAANQAKKEKTSNTMLYVGIAVVVVVVPAVVGVLLFQQNKPAVSPENYVADGLTVGKDNTPVQPLKMPEGEEPDLPAPSEAGANENAATVTVYINFQSPGCKASQKGNSPMLRSIEYEVTIYVH